MDSKEQNIKIKFKELTEKSKPKPNIVKNCIFAFIIGGLICDVGQFISNILMNMGLGKDEVATYTTIIMIFIGALLTGLGIYDKIANYGGAGTVVPITGFSNSIVSPAIEFKKEGYVFGVGAKMFTIAGPVLVYGITSSVVIGLIYYFVG
ncbi:MAG: stage V sporulation protein AC [Clostridiaceae bacterium]